MSSVKESRWKTLARADSEFKSYLEGHFSRDYFAIPTRSLNVDTSKEQVTFEIIPASELWRPSLAKIFLRLLRPITLTLSLSPALISVLYMRTFSIAFDRELAGLTLLGVIWFHGSMNLLNDYYDHVKGDDRINPKGGTRAIQLGWVRAYQVKRTGFCLLAVSALLGLPSLFVHPSILILIAIFALAAGLEFSSRSLGLKFRGGGEIIFFLLTGPFLSMGFSWAVATDSVPREHWGPLLLIGTLFGVASLFYYHLANLEDILVDSQSGSCTLAVQQGFDRAKAFQWVVAALIPVALLAFAWRSGLFRVLAPLSVLVVISLFLICTRVSKANSPLSSDLANVRIWGLRLHWMIFILMYAALG